MNLSIQDGDTALLFAAKRGNMEAIRLLLLKGADLTATNNVIQAQTFGITFG